MGFVLRSFGALISGMVIGSWLAILGTINPVTDSAALSFSASALAGVVLWLLLALIYPPDEKILKRVSDIDQKYSKRLSDIDGRLTNIEGKLSNIEKVALKLSKKKK